MARLLRIHDLPTHSGELDRLVVLRSYPTTWPDPNDIDCVVMMRADLMLSHPQAEALALFNHGLAAAVLGASTFRVRSGMLVSKPLDPALAW
jgi:hypothetical protein